ncbi:hypothetical protein [Nonomuraea jiangxiensis]|uniref:Uncharacterized protein n=1 Tax=Nonomuraea jiangxiensis TaxID=633440 RepID=A0A1G8NJH4_9ACTN|nr:hypothetical protein [Nonomuraea jiangxiensis]SDI80374.1 hypothetical protein SAMN05421869_107143 [Nonomuraea jiangxiensis]
MSAIVLALGLAGAGVTPFIMQSASASAAYDPVQPCDVGEVCDAAPETTVTITTTTTLDTPPAEQPQDTPETTITKTVTASPTKRTTSPKPTRTKTSTPPPVSTSVPTQNLQPLPTQSIEVPPTTTSSSPEPSVQLPAIATTEPTVPSVTPSETEAASTEEVLELRQAAPEFDQRTLTQQLSIPALVLVLLALFAVLIFEGRLRRMAHAAAVRKAGPQAGRPDTPPVGGGYPAGPGYATAGFPAPGYPGGTAYAPIISFVPVQTYPSGPAQYGAVYQEPHPYPHHGYADEPPVPEAPPESMVLHPDEFDSYNEPPSKTREFRDPFEPVIQPVEVPSPDIPPGGADPYDDDPERPLGGPAAAWAEPGDSEPWQQSSGRSLFEPAPKPGQDDAPRDYDPPPYLAADEGATAIQPLPAKQDPAPEESGDGGREPTKEMPDSTRRRWGRKKK